MTLFRLDASIRTQGSASREIADIVEAEWLAVHPGDTIERPQVLRFVPQPAGADDHRLLPAWHMALRIAAIG